MTEQEFIDELKKMNIILTSEQIEKFSIYANFLIEYNNHTNLTTITNLNDIYLKHFYDSLTILNYLDSNKINNILDIGTGAGFPGMVLAIIFPNKKITLLDSNNKKITFLSELCKKINVDNVELINKRAEDLVKTNRNMYDLVTSRAVANLYTLSELSIPLVKINGYFVSLKGNVEEELRLAKSHIQVIGGSIESIFEFKLPKEDSTRNIIKIKKINDNPKYPRLYSKIKSEYEHITKSN